MVNGVTYFLPPTLLFLEPIGTLEVVKVVSAVVVPVLCLTQRTRPRETSARATSTACPLSTKEHTQSLNETLDARTEVGHGRQFHVLLQRMSSTIPETSLKLYVVFMKLGQLMDRKRFERSSKRR